MAVCCVIADDEYCFIHILGGAAMEKQKIAGFIDDEVEGERSITLKPYKDGWKSSG